MTLYPVYFETIKQHQCVRSIILTHNKALTRPQAQNTPFSTCQGTSKSLETSETEVADSQSERAQAGNVNTQNLWSTVHSAGEEPIVNQRRHNLYKHTQIQL